MANITITRADGSTEQVGLAAGKTDGVEWLGVQCSDGIVRYARLVDAGDSGASHMWYEKNGVRKYLAKDPSTIPSGQFGPWNFPGNNDSIDTPITIPAGITKVSVQTTKTDGTTDWKTVAVNPGETLTVSAMNYSFSGGGVNVSGTLVMLLRPKSGDANYAAICYTDTNSASAKSLLIQYSPTINTWGANVSWEG